jgi:hypothetical protein
MQWSSGGYLTKVFRHAHRLLKGLNFLSTEIAAKDGATKLEGDNIVGSGS